MTQEIYPDEISYFENNLDLIYNTMIVERDEDEAINLLNKLNEDIKAKFPEKSLVSIFKFKTKSYDAILISGSRIWF